MLVQVEISFGAGGRGQADKGAQVGDRLTEMVQKAVLFCSWQQAITGLRTRDPVASKRVALIHNTAEQVMGQPSSPGSTSRFKLVFLKALFECCLAGIYTCACELGQPAGVVVEPKWEAGWSLRESGRDQRSCQTFRPARGLALPSGCARVVALANLLGWGLLQ